MMEAGIPLLTAPLKASEGRVPGAGGRGCFPAEC